MDFSAHPLEEIPPKRPRLRLLGRKAGTENLRAQAILYVLNIYISLFSFSFSSVLIAVTEFGRFFLSLVSFFFSHRAGLVFSEKKKGGKNKKTFFSLRGILSARSNITLSDISARNFNQVGKTGKFHYISKFSFSPNPVLTDRCRSSSCRTRRHKRAPRSEAASRRRAGRAAGRAAGCAMETLYTFFLTSS